MDSERFVSSICSSSSSAAAFTEMDAAEALAELAQLAVKDNVSVSTPSATGGGGWGSKGKRVSKRVKSESPPLDSELKLKKSVDTIRLDLSTKRHSDLVQEDDDEVKVDNNNDNDNDNVNDDDVIILNPVKVEVDSSKSSSIDNTTRNVSILASGRSRQNLTEAEKEERKMRRILANRESARQTIHRRQALCRELTKKAADLTQENEDLKKKRELAFNEYQSLETINKQLKAQMAEAAKIEAAESAREHKPTYTEISASPSTSLHLHLYDQPPFLPFCWPSIMQPGQSQYGPPNTFVLPPNIPLQATGRPDFSDELGNKSEPKTPLYMVPYTWFYPYPEHGNSLHTRPSFGHVPDESSVSNPSTSTLSTLENFPRFKPHEFSYPFKVNDEAEARPDTDLNETLTDSLSDRINEQHLVTQLTLAPLGPTFAVKQENDLESDYPSNNENNPTKASNGLGSSYPKNNLALVDCSNKKITDAVAAAEARKRRKELTKLKNLYGRQCRV
ncbi:hypothetical protein ACFE04_000226 [Oxalis oulophora]